MVCAQVYAGGYIMHLSLVVNSYVCEVPRQSIMLFTYRRPLKFIDWDCRFIFSPLFMPIFVSCILKLSLVIPQFRILKSSWWKMCYQYKTDTLFGQPSILKFICKMITVISPTLCWMFFFHWFVCWRALSL